MNKIPYIDEIIKTRFKDYKFLKFPLYEFGYPVDDYFLEYIENNYILTYHGERGTNEVIIQTDNEVDVISQITSICSWNVAYEFATKNRINCIDFRIFLFAKHVELLYYYEEINMANKMIKEYNQLLGYNIFKESDNLT